MATTKIDLGQVVPKNHYQYMPMKYEVNASDVGQRTPVYADFQTYEQSDLALKAVLDEEAFEVISSVTTVDEHTFPVIKFKKKGIVRISLRMLSSLSKKASGDMISAADIRVCYTNGHVTEEMGNIYLTRTVAPSGIVTGMSDLASVTLTVDTGYMFALPYTYLSPENQSYDGVVNLYLDLELEYLSVS